ncbi:selenoprotein V-like [Macrobrachium rosenbergii]|uniref:selenoprotein V-like n=1 Tax=Macrobrachium rosenbergii TaxID=79674 RepID=UPI0034D5C2CF
MTQIGTTSSTPAPGSSAFAQAHTFVPRWSEAKPERPQGPALNPLPVPLECPEQCQALTILTVEPLPNQIPVTGPDPVPVPRHTLTLPLRDPKLDTELLPVPPECLGQCHVPPIEDIEKIHDLVPVPGPVSVSVPEHAIDLPPRYPSLGCLSPSGLASLPVPV